MRRLANAFIEVTLARKQIPRSRFCRLKQVVSDPALLPIDNPHSVVGLKRDLELERRKTRELQDVARERDKEYQKLKVCVVSTYF